MRSNYVLENIPNHTKCHSNLTLDKGQAVFQRQSERCFCCDLLNIAVSNANTGHVNLCA